MIPMPREHTPLWSDDEPLLPHDAKTAAPSYVPEPLQFKEKPRVPAGKRINRVRMALLFAVGAMAFYTVLRMLLRH